MAETKGHTVVPPDAAVNAVTGPPPVESPQETEAVDAALDAYRRTVEREVDTLTDDMVLDRLDRVRRRVDRWADAPGNRRQVDDLTGYAFGVVQVWLSAILTRGGHRVGLSRDDIAELAGETVAQALNSCALEPARPVLLARCVSALPLAYRRWRLRSGAVELDELASLGGDSLEADLRHWVTHGGASGDIVAATVEALRIAADRGDRT